MSADYWGKHSSFFLPFGPIEFGYNTFTDITLHLVHLILAPSSSKLKLSDSYLREWQQLFLGFYSWKSGFGVLDLSC